MVELSDLLAELPEMTRNSTSGALDNTKRTRAINRVLEDLQDFADWEPTKRTKTFKYIDGVHEYSLEDYVGTTCLDNDGLTSILDFKNARDLRLDSGSFVPFDLFDAKRVRADIQRGSGKNEFAAENGVLIVNYPRSASRLLHDMDSITANGTWAVSGSASGLAVDEQEYTEGDASLSFDATSATSLVLSNSTMTAMDLSDFEGVSHLLVDVYLPSISSFSSLTLRFGDDLTANYWEVSVTTPAGAASLLAGDWNTFALDWASATKTGSPSSASVNAARFTIAYSSGVTANDFHIDNFRIARWTRMELDYFSLAMVKNTGGSHQLEFNPDSVTQTDYLIDDAMRRTVAAGATYELFKILGGKSERDRTDSFKEYEIKKTDLLKRFGYRLRRGGTVLNFPRRR